MNNAEMVDLAHQNLINTYGCVPLAFVRGNGAYLYDADGNRYLDFFCGLAVTSLGHAHPRVVRAIKEQAEKLTHVSNVFHTEPMARLAARLCAPFWRRARVLLQLGRRGQRGRDQARAPLGPRPRRRPLRDRVHARLVPWPHLGTLSATGQEKYHSGFQPLVPGFQHGPLRRRRGARARRSRRDGRHPGRADPGRGRRGHARTGLPRALRELCDRRKHPADPRRGADRDGPHGQALRVPARRASSPTS